MKALNPIKTAESINQEEWKVVVTGTPSDQMWTFPTPVELPSIPVIMQDSGKSPDNGIKLAMFINPYTLNIKKVPCNLAKKQGHIPQTNTLDFFSEAYNEPDEGSIQFEMDGMVYSAGHLAADEGGDVQLGKDKWVDMKPRVAAALNLFGIEGDFALCVTATYENLEHF